MFQKLNLCSKFLAKGCWRRFWNVSNAPTKLNEKRSLNLPIETLFHSVLDVDSYHEFLPFCAHSRIIRHIPPNSFEADLSIGFQSFYGTYTSLVTYKRLIESDWTISAKSIDSSLFEKMDSNWVSTIFFCLLCSFYTFCVLSDI